MIINIQQILNTNPDYTLAVMFEDSTFNVTRYVLYTGVNALPLPVPSVPYAGQVILKNFRLEIWNTSDGSVTQTIPLTFVTSVLGGQDYRYGNDFQLAGNNGSIVSFQSLYVASTTPPSNDLVARWNANNGVTAVGPNVHSWASMINANDILLPSGANYPSLLHSIGTINNSSWITFSNTNVLSTTSLNGGGGYSPYDVFCVFSMTNTATNGTIFNFSDVKCKLEASNADSQHILINTDWAPILPVTVGRHFFCVRINNAASLAQVTELVDWTIKSTATGTPNISPSVNLTLGGYACSIVELLVYQSQQPQPVSDLIYKYISDTYDVGMMSLPLTFPDTKPIN